MLNYKQRKNGAKEILTYIKRSHEVTEVVIESIHNGMTTLKKIKNEKKQSQHNIYVDKRSVYLVLPYVATHK